jgi:hypothetical protein
MRLHRGPSAVLSSGRRARLGSTFAGPALDPSAYLQRKERAVANVFLRVEIAERRSLVCEPAPRLRPDQAGEEVDGAWRSLRDAAGLPRFRFHDLRHTVVTDLLEAGEPSTLSRPPPGSSPRRCWSTTRTSGSRQKVRCSLGEVPQKKGTA